MITAHGLVAPEQVWAWHPAPALIAGLVLTAAVYGRGLALRRIGVRRAAAFYAGLLTVALALASPLDHISSTLFAAHMSQHMILVLGAAPLIVYGRPVLVSGHGLPGPLRRTVASLSTRDRVRRFGRMGTNPFLVLVAHASALWIWHVPAAYRSALENAALHAVEHVSLLVTALLFWSLVIDARPRRRLARGGGLLYLFVALLSSKALGALLVFSPMPLYGHGAGARLWGLSPIEDQQLAGTFMWVPMTFMYLVAIAVLFIAWMKEMDRRVLSTAEAGR
jgi:putative membrane protein